MIFSALTNTLLKAKDTQGLTFTALGHLLERDEVWVAALFYGQARASEAEAKTLLAALGLEMSLVGELTAYPTKGLGPVVPTDPLIYRFYEILQVYGFPLKAVIQEQFGDGIMSAIDFTLGVEREADPQGDRVKITMSGKFLPYKKW